MLVTKLERKGEKNNGKVLFMCVNKGVNGLVLGRKSIQKGVCMDGGEIPSSPNHLLAVGSNPAGRHMHGYIYVIANSKLLLIFFKVFYRL